MSPTRILLADDHALVRAGFRALLHELGIQVVAEANNGNEALRLIELHQPDMVLMDIAMPELNGLEATARVAEAFPNVRVIILSMYAFRALLQAEDRSLAASLPTRTMKSTGMRPLCAIPCHTPNTILGYGSYDNGFSRSKPLL